MVYCKYSIITTTVDNQATAQSIIDSLLEKRLVACVQTHTVTSHYHWEGKIEKSSEIVISCKTKSALFKRVEAQIISLHSYELPEIVMIPILEANDSYLEWIDSNLLQEEN